MSKEKLILAAHVVREVFTYKISDIAFNYDNITNRDTVDIVFVNEKLDLVTINTNMSLKPRVEWLLNDAISEQIKIIEKTMETR